MGYPFLPISAVPITFVSVLGVVLIVLIVLSLTKKKEWSEIEQFDPLRVTQTHLGFRNHFGLEITMYVLRWCFLLFAIGIEFYVYAMSNASLSFYTVWNFSLLCFYFGGAVICQSWKYIGLPQNKIFYLLCLGTSVVFEIEYPTSWLVDVVLWGILFPFSPDPASMFELSSIVQHITNVFMLSVDFIFNDIPFQPFGIVFLLCLPVIYSIFSFIYYSQTGIWNYFFLDPNVPEAIGWYVAIAVLHVVFFYIIYGFYLLKVHLVQHCEVEIKVKTEPKQDFEPQPPNPSNTFNEHQNEQLEI